MSATYEVGEADEPLEREEVERRGIVEFVGARCSPVVEVVEVVALDSVRRLACGCCACCCC